MNIVNLYASCHSFISNSSDMTGGVTIILPDVPEIVPFYSTTHLTQWNYDTTLKGGTLQVPSSLSDLSSGNLLNLNTPTVSPIAAGICADFGLQVDGLLDGINQAKDILNSPYDLLRDELNGLSGSVASSPYDMLNGLDSLASAAEKSVPDLPDVSEIERIMQACNLLRGNLLGGMMSPSEILGKYLDQALNFLGGLIEEALKALGAVFGLIEAAAAFIMNEINKLLKALGISDLIAKLDGLFNCIESICGRSFDIPTDITEPIQPVSERFYLDYIDESMNYVNNMLNDMNLDDFGNFDSSKIFAEIDGVPQDIFDNISSISNTALNESEKAKESLVALVDDMKPMMDTVVSELKVASEEFPGTPVEMLEVVDQQEEEIKDLIVTLEETVDVEKQEELITQIDNINDKSTDILNPVVFQEQTMKSFFT